jgi:hypothetical protein
MILAQIRMTRGAWGRVPVLGACRRVLRVVLRARLFRGAAFELPKAGDHQPVGLARQRSGEDGMALSITRELLRKRDEIPAARRHALGLFEHSYMIACPAMVGNLIGVSGSV